jgi:hypothetical protein
LQQRARWRPALRPYEWWLHDQRRLLRGQRLSYTSGLDRGHLRTADPTPAAARRCRDAHPPRRRRLRRIWPDMLQHDPVLRARGPLSFRRRFSLQWPIRLSLPDSRQVGHPSP